MLSDRSVATRENFDEFGRSCEMIASGVWFPEETDELSIYSKKYDFILEETIGASSGLPGA
jgi:hypothetical protein